MVKGCGDERSSTQQAEEKIVDLREGKPSAAEQLSGVPEEGGNSPPKPEPTAVVWMKRINPWYWPWYAKYPVLALLFIGLVFYYRDQRVGDGVFAPKKDEPEKIQRTMPDPHKTSLKSSLGEMDVGGGVKAVLHYGVPWLVYRDGTMHPADGMMVTVVTKEQDAEAPSILDPFRKTIAEDDWPVVVFTNASGFDTTGEIVAIRRHWNGRLRYKSPSALHVKLVVHKPEGKYKAAVITSDGLMTAVDDKQWATGVLRVDPPPTAEELEKMTDDELKKRGFERIPIDEAKKRGLIDEKGNPIRPRLTIQDLQKKDK